MPTLSRVLVPLDGSSRSEGSLPYAQAVLAPGGEIVVMMTSALPAHHVTGPRGRPADHLVHAQREYLEKIRARLQAEGVTVRTILHPGMPADGILDTAAREQADIIVMTSRGGSSVERWAVGSVTERIVRHSPVPVLVVRR